jgi:hypothetical protein
MTDSENQMTGRLTTALNYSINLYLMLQNACGNSAFFDTTPDVDDILQELADVINPMDLESHLLRSYAEMVRNQYLAAGSTSHGGYFRPPTEVSLSDLASEFVSSDFGARISNETQKMESLLAASDDKGAIARNAPIFLEISAMSQPVGDILRYGLLAVAAGHLEQNLTLLEACSGEIASPVLEGRSKLDNLISTTNSRVGPQFDPEGTLCKMTRYAVAVRHSVVHREARFDPRFIEAVGRDAVPVENDGLMIDTSASSISTYLSQIFGFAIRSCIFSLIQSLPNSPYGATSADIARRTFALRHDAAALAFLEDIPLDDSLIVASQR